MGRTVSIFTANHSKYRARRVIQGDIISPVLFILVLDQIMQQYDGGGKGKGGARGKGMKCGRVFRIKVLGYADDLALVEEGVEEMTRRVTKIADTDLEQADMQVNVDKTFTQHVHERTSITVSAEEVVVMEAGYTHQCDFCIRRFKTKRGMMIHDTSSEMSA